MLSQPFFQVRKLDRPWLLQSARSESAHPVVVDAKRRRDGSVLPYSRLNRIPGLLNSLFNVHFCVDTIVVLCHYSSTLGRRTK